MVLMQNSYGYTVALTTNLDLSTATVIRVRLIPPGDIPPIDKRFTHADVVDGATGVLTVGIDQGDLIHAGEYAIEAVDESPGRFAPSAVGKFRVEPSRV